MIRVTNTIELSEDEIEERFIRAPGPGGQNVKMLWFEYLLSFDKVFKQWQTSQKPIVT